MLRLQLLHGCCARQACLPPSGPDTSVPLPPVAQLHNPESRQVLQELGFKYDSSIVESWPSATSPASSARLFPYSMAAGIPQDCQVGAGRQWTAGGSSAILTCTPSQPFPPCANLLPRPRSGWPPAPAPPPSATPACGRSPCCSSSRGPSPTARPWRSPPWWEEGLRYPVAAAARFCTRLSPHRSTFCCPAAGPRRCQRRRAARAAAAAV